ncbi:MAG: PD-(D/E)XK nuclease family protein [Acidobacteriota bacterium]|nr:PD-(D/E)XK nuclease family protein [Acidobacteriota bacterium]
MLLLTGPDASATTAFVLERFRERVRSGQSDFRIIVPTNTLEHHLQNQLAREGIVFRPDLIRTLSGFTKAFTESLAEVSAATLHLMVEQAVKRARRPEFEKVAEMAGFHASLAYTLADLDKAGCGSELLGRHLVRAPLGEALLAVWRDVESEMRRRGAGTRAAVLRVAAASIRERGLARVVAIAFDGFATFSDPELDLLKAMSERVDVTVTLPDADFSQTARARLIAMGFREETSEPTARNDSAARHLRVPDNIEREADEIARRILIEAQNGTPFREIGVVLRNPDAYEPLLRSTFERFGIPARFYFEKPLSQHPVGQFICGLVEAKRSGWEHENILHAFRLAPKTGVSSAMDRFDIEMRKGFPKRGLDNLPDLAESDEYLRKMVEICRSGLGGIPEPREVFRPGRVPDEVSWNTAFIYRSQAAALAGFEAAVEEARTWHDFDPVPASFDTFWQTVETILSLTTLRVPDGRRNVVHVLSAFEARQWNLGLVFVPGLVEGEFPKHHPQNAFLPDAAIRALQAAGVRPRTSEDRDAEEKFLFESAVARVNGPVFLSHPRADARGEPTVPSTFLNDRKADENCVSARPQPFPVPEKFRPSSIIAQPDLLRVLNAQHASFSASALETYLQCPFQFFALKTLRLREFPPRPEDRLDFLIRGNIVHKFLAEWFRDRPPIGPLFDRIFAESCRDNCVPSGYRTEMWRHRMIQDIERFCAKDEWPRGALVETEVEFKFQLDESVAVNGRLDRLERLEDGSGIVVDYKYSKAETARKLIEDETKLQAPIYLLAIERAFGLKPAAMAYYSLRGDLKTSGRGSVPGLETDWEPITREWLDASAGTIIENVRQLRDGRILPAPASVEPCRYCDVRDVCRYEKAAALTASGE